MATTDKKILTNTIIWGLATGALYEAFFKKFDQPILYWVNRHSWLSLKKFSTGLSQIFSAAHWTELGLICLVFFFVLGIALKIRPEAYSKLAKFRLHLGFLGFSLFITALLTTFIKYGLARYRPEMLLEKGLYGFHFFSTRHEYNSTPSGHTALSFAGLLAISHMLKKSWVTWILVTLAIVIGVSRLVLSQHYASDVILGIYIGTIGTYWVKSVREW